MELLLPILERNPHKSLTLEVIRMPGESDTSLADESMVIEYDVNWARLQPPGPLSLYLWSTNSIYRAGTETLRRNMINEKIIDLQQRIQVGEIPSSRKFTKSKLAEAFGITIENASEENFECLEKAISHLGSVQWIRIHETDKKVTFIPEDLRLWDSEKPILWTRERYRSAGEIPKQGVFTLAQLSKWISDREVEGWKMQFPVAEGTLESLKQEYTALNLGLPKSSSDKGRILKEDYAKALGRMQVFQHLRSQPQVKV